MFIFGLRIHLEVMLVRFLYEDHRVKVKVRLQKLNSAKNPYSRNIKLRSAFGITSGSIDDSAAKFACGMGFLAMVDRMV